MQKSNNNLINRICDKLNKQPDIDELSNFLLLTNLDKFEYKTRTGTWTFIPDKPPARWNSDPVIVVIEKCKGLMAYLKDGLYKGTI